MVAELRFDRPLHLADFRAENHFIKLTNHLAGAEGSERAAIASGRALRMLFCQRGKIRAVGVSKFD